LRLEELHADGKAVALHRLAVSHPGRGTKFSGTRNEIEPVIGLPAARTDHACAAFADIFRKSSFCARFLPKAASDDEVRALVREALVRLGVSDGKQAGRVVGELMKANKGKLDPSAVKRIVDEELAPPKA